jgi:hypothetical protein
VKQVKSKGLFTNNSSWQTSQSILHATLTFYADCVKMCEDFTVIFGGKRSDCCIMTMHEESFGQEQHGCHRTPAILTLLGPL